VGFEQWIRYLVPGYVALAPLIFAIVLLPNKYQMSQNPLIAALLAIGPGIGFVVHQIYMCYHEKYFLTSPKRPVIKQIIGINNEITAQEAHRAWDYFFHDSKTNNKDLFEHISRCWYFIHSFRSTGLAFFFGFSCLVFLLVVPCFQDLKTPAIYILICKISLFSYIIASLFFFWKSKLTMRFVEHLEALIVHNHEEEIERVLTTIIELR